jgi:hypothetical protein
MLTAQTVTIHPVKVFNGKCILWKKYCIKIIQTHHISYGKLKKKNSPESRRGIGKEAREKEEKEKKGLGNN